MTESPAAPPSGADQRKKHTLRKIFPAAQELIAPFFDPAQAWGGRSLDYLAFRVLRENFPQLAQEDLHALVVAARSRANAAGHGAR